MSDNVKQIDRNLPPITSPQDNSRLVGNIQEVGVPPSPGPQNSLNPDSQYNVFSTGSLIEALSAPPSAPSHGPAMPPQRKAGHKRRSSTRHPYAPDRNAIAARAAVLAKRAEISAARREMARHMSDMQQAAMSAHQAQQALAALGPQALPEHPTLAMQQALAIRRHEAMAALQAAQQTLFRQQAPRIPSQISRVSARLPLVPVRQAGLQIGRSPQAVPVQQGPVMPPVGNVTPGRRVDASFSMVVQVVHGPGGSLALYQTAQPRPRSYIAPVSDQARNPGTYPAPF
ncbi:hypothetical protein C8R45DRAFT_480819 [Mycena sanguinolenta]|nr:hypothetical protein C8R45DRAFT_480819 [Mycena sanguinolenta]